MKQLVLQNIVMPREAKHVAKYKLFYQGARCRVDEQGVLNTPTNTIVDFATYLNGFAMNKWREYTNIKGVTLKITVEGEMDIKLTGYSLEPTSPARHEYESIHVKALLPETFTLHYPADVAQEFLAFEMHVYGQAKFISGQYIADYEESDIRDVTLSLSTTTCKKEDYIKHNIEVIKESLLAEDSSIRENFYVHVVDNGNTLTTADINGYHVSLHPNRNTGGSGGFARGMMESMHQNPKATHVLLMDDDVLILPESIYRTYMLLATVKDEYYDYSVSGAMLEMDEMYTLHEDIGTATFDTYFVPSRDEFELDKLDEVMNVNIPIPHIDNKYAAWWYCCIPMHVIERSGLPLPLFIRCDDAEYGIRTGSKFMNMTSICVWHMGFGNKFNGAMEIYQEFRNRFIAIAMTPWKVAMPPVKVRFRREFHHFIKSYAYDTTELLLKALEDYMKGPEWLEQADGEKIIGENRKLNEDMQPLNKAYPDFEVRPADVLFNIDPKTYRSKVERFLYLVTMNGQRWYPKSKLKKGFVTIGNAWSSQHYKQSFYESLLAVNVTDMTGHLRVQDRKRFRELYKRYKQDMKNYEANWQQINAQYAARKDYMTSEEFWVKYLGIEPYEK